MQKTSRVWIDGASMPNVVQHLSKILEPSLLQVSDQNKKCAGQGGGGAVIDPQTDRRLRSRLGGSSLLQVIRLVHLIT